MKTAKFTRSFFVIILFNLQLFLFSASYYVSPSGSDHNAGTEQAPFKTIQKAADVAEPGDIVIVQSGVYREHVNPKKGGASFEKPIVFQSAPGAHVEITGTEELKGWTKISESVWRVDLPTDYFKEINPFFAEVKGDWYQVRKNRKYHLGAVYVDGIRLIETARLKEVIENYKNDKFKLGFHRFFAEAIEGKTRLWIHLPSAQNPNEAKTEINVRKTVFYPTNPGINYITVRGFTLRGAANPWSPPTAEQIGIIGTHWSKGWVIENNTIFHAVCAGVTLGKFGDEWDNKSESPEGFSRSIDLAIKRGWTKETIGHHLVLNNKIFDCGQAGVVGSMGGAFSRIEGNEIYDIYSPDRGAAFGGCEMAGIKLHGGVDVTIARNLIHRCGTHAIWLDWMTQGTRVTRNLMLGTHGVLFEVNHGPILFDHNILQGKIENISEGMVIAHNLIMGDILNIGDDRLTPFFKPHSLDLVKFAITYLGDHHVLNNIITKADLSYFDRGEDFKKKKSPIMLPVRYQGNVYLGDATPPLLEKNPTKLEMKPVFQFVEKNGNWTMRTDPEFTKALVRASENTATFPVLTTENLGLAVVPSQAYENSNGTPLKLTFDYLGLARNEKKPHAGPFEDWIGNEIPVWPIKPIN